MQPIEINPSELVKRNSFDIKTLDKTLHEMKETSYNNLNVYQRDLTGFNRFDFSGKDLKRRRSHSDEVPHIHYEITVPYEFVLVRNRLAYKRSKVYKKEMTFRDVKNNMSVFNKTFMVFIDGKFTDNIRILPLESDTVIILDEKSVDVNGIPETYLDYIIDSDIPITVLFMPNTEFGAYQTDAKILWENRDRLESFDTSIKDNLKDPLRYLSFINSNLYLFFNSKSFDLSLTDEISKFFNGSSENEPVHVNMFGFSHLKYMKEIKPGENFIRFEGLKMPIPIENIILFKLDRNGRLNFAHDLSTRRYYPNIFEIVGKGDVDTVFAYVFYSDDLPDSTLKYTNDLRIYNLLMDITPTKYQSGDVLTDVKDYTPTQVTFNHPDYVSSIFNDSHLEYKLNKLQDLTLANPNYFKEYLRNIQETLDSYYIDLSKVDYDSKLRYNNSDVVSSSIEHTEFSDERVLIILKNDRRHNRGFRLYIDGLIYNPTDYWQSGIYIYYYIPTSRATRTSMVEIEAFDTFSLSRSFIPDNVNDFVQVALKENYKFFVNDIYIIDKESGVFLQRGIDYKVALPAGDGEYFYISEESFKVVDNNIFLIQFINDYYLEKMVTIFASRTESMKTYRITTDTAIKETFTLATNSHPDIRHFRVYRNGHLLPQDLYSFFAPNNINGTVQINPSVLKLRGDVFTLDYVPHRYKVIYSMREIPIDGFLDLKNIIDKPLDLKWYDFYLNGRRLTKNQLFFSSPTMVTFYNVNSINNLVILERDRDDEILTMGEDPMTIIDHLEDIDPIFSDKLRNFIVLTDDTIVPIDDIVTTEIDIITEIIEVEDLALQDLVDGLLKRFTFLNPDWQQLEIEDYLQRPTFFVEDGTILPINPDNFTTGEKYSSRIGFDVDYTDDGANSVTGD